jgi:hypothetical protein
MGKMKYKIFIAKPKDNGPLGRPTYISESEVINGSQGNRV